MDQIPNSIALANLIQLGLEALLAALLCGCIAYALMALAQLAWASILWRHDHKLANRRVAAMRSRLDN